MISTHAVCLRRDGTRRRCPPRWWPRLVKDKTFPDPLFGMNLRDFPGVNYPIGGNFSNIPMAPDSPYAVSWWYRKQFAVPASYKGKTIWLKFNGINYRANIFLNGKQIAKSDDVAGAWRTYEFNVTDSGQGRGGERPRGAGLLARPTTIWPSHSWTGIPRHPTRIWDCGARSISRPAGRWRCDIPQWCRN